MLFLYKLFQKIEGTLLNSFYEAAAAKSLQSCPTLCNPIDGSPPGPPIPGILQARTLEWVTISFSNAWKWKVKVKSLSRVRLLATPWTAAHQAPPSIGFSRQEYWSGVPLLDNTKRYCKKTPSLMHWDKWTKKTLPSYTGTNGPANRIQQCLNSIGVVLCW